MYAIWNNIHGGRHHENRLLFSHLSHQFGSCFDEVMNRISQDSNARQEDTAILFDKMNTLMKEVAHNARRIDTCVAKLSSVHQLLRDMINPLAAVSSFVESTFPSGQDMLKEVRTTSTPFISIWPLFRTARGQSTPQS